MTPTQRLLAVYHFIGGIPFAILLLTIAAVLVIVGTILESTTGSHLYAAQFTYGNPLFALLIACFFLNILVSALRRWPFQWRHFPFLITHLGLLMILSGALAKSLFGIQGDLTIVEGTGSHKLLLPHTTVLRLESLDRPPVQWKVVKPLFGKPSLRPVGEHTANIQVRLLAYRPHAKQQLSLWTKNDRLQIEGLPRLPLLEWNEKSSKPLPIAPFTFQPTDKSPNWSLQAFHTPNTSEMARQAYVQGVSFRVRDRKTGKFLLESPLSRVLEGPTSFEQGMATARLELPLSATVGLEGAALIVDLEFAGQKQTEQIQIPLNGPHVLLNQNKTSSYLGSLPIEITLQRQPTLVFIRDTNESEYLFGFDAHGEASCQAFRPQDIESLYTLSDGYDGYALQAQLVSAMEDLPSREQRRQEQLIQELQSSRQNNEPLSPPLALLADSCRQADVDFPSTCIDFLHQWDISHRWLYPGSQPLSPNAALAMEQLGLEQMSADIRNYCSWVCLVTESLEEHLQSGYDLASYLQQSGWPLPLSEGALRDPALALETLQGQLFAVRHQLPPSDPSLPSSAEDRARQLSAYLRLYGIHLARIGPEPPAALVEPFYLHCRVKPSYRPEMPSAHLESNHPMARVALSAGDHTDQIALGYDPSTLGLRWPVLNGSYLARLQPQTIDIPYHVRLRDARKISYPSSTQAFSYEADILVTDTRTNTAVETTLSMNRVHETPDGYRFYLSSISPAEETTARRVHIAVNRDPAKYSLTYTGSVVMTLGIILLFTLWPYRSN